MKDDIRYINKFDACVKIALRNELLYRLRTIKNQRKHYINMSEMSVSQLNSLCTVDVYPSDCFQKKITTSLFDVAIHDELLYEALLLVKPETRDLLILKYWGNMTDQQLGEQLCISRKMANYYKNKALISLRNIIEEIRKNEK